jgi:ferritin heavy chain
MSLAKQNFANSSEEALNQQVNTELQASQVYLSMSAWAQHTSVALPGNNKLHTFIKSRKILILL